MEQKQDGTGQGERHRGSGAVPKCSTLGCEDEVFCKEMCPRHYRQKLYADGISRRTPSMTANETLRRGGTLKPPRTLPYRTLAKTCPKCGDLWTTPDHLLRKDSGPLPQCRKCSRRKARDKDKQRLGAGQSRTKVRRQRRQEETVNGARNHRKEWTGPELEVAARAELTTREVATILGRTFHAVAHKRSSMNDPKVAALAGLSRG